MSNGPPPFNREDDAFKRRVAGLARTGIVGLRDFDVGVIDTIAGVNRLENDDTKVGPIGIYVTQVPGVCPPDGYPGIPIVFANPEDVTTPYKMPFINVRRDDLSAAMERWHPSGQQYRAPGEGALPVTVKAPGGQVLTGFDRYEELSQAIPYDITYTISVKGRFRGAGNLAQRNNMNALFQYVHRIFPPYGKIDVVDSIGDLRSYEAFNEGIANLDGVGEVQDRILGMAITLRVEAELDLRDPFTARSVKSLTLRARRL